MLISKDWISDFVELPSNINPVEFSELTTLKTAEVEGIEKSGEVFEKVFIGQIKSLRKHPDADKLNLVTFDYGREIKEVVCGASNVREGLKIVYAPTGVTLPNGLTLEPKKIRGFLSEGMICSEEELGLGQGSEGILELSDDAPVGNPLSEFLNIKSDVILEVDNKSLTHRPDLWGHYGFAREYSAIFKTPLKPIFDEKGLKTLKDYQDARPAPIKLEVAENSSCLIYLGLSLENVVVGESPEWLKARLTKVGLRPINNIVDVSNYVMLELGSPLHIFDRQKIAGDKVLIKGLAATSSFTTLDEVERELTPGDTVIADKEKTLVLAGIMGGLNSGVEENTTDIFIEVANWKAAEVRKTSTRLGLRTDSSQRFEKSLDSQQCEQTLWRTVQLILELCPGAQVVGKLQSAGPETKALRPLVIETQVARFEKILGIELGKDKVESILDSLGFEIKSKGNQLTVQVPSFRATKDIECEADLIEEIGRMIGYGSIPASSPQWGIEVTKLSQTQKVHRRIQDFLVCQGKALEVMTYPLVGESLLKKACWNHQENLVLANALSDDHDRLRTSLIPSALESISKNTKNFSHYRFFEIGRSYLSGGEFCEEPNDLLMCSFDKQHNQFLDVLNTIESLLIDLEVPYQLEEGISEHPSPLLEGDWEGLHPHEMVNIKIMGKNAGHVFSLHPLLLRNFKVKGKATLALLRLSIFEEKVFKSKSKYRPLAKFPEAVFDCTVVAAKKTSVGEILQLGRKFKIKEMKSFKVVDVYNLSESQNTVTLRATFQDPDKTLPGELVKTFEEKIVKMLIESGYPLKS